MYEDGVGWMSGVRSWSWSWPQAGLARGGTLMKTNHAQSSSDLLLTSYDQYTMDDMDNNQQEIDPLSDPEERRVLYSALDSFR